MEDLTPPVLTAVREVKWLIEGGHSMKQAVSLYLEPRHEAYALALREAWTLRWQSTKTHEPEWPTSYQKAFWELIDRGCRGQPVLEALTGLETEILRAATDELDEHLATLPFKVLIPLLTLQFPAHLVMMLGPLLRELQTQLGGS